MKYEQRALITSIDDPNKVFEVKITNCPTAVVVGANTKKSLPLPTEQFSAYFEIGDVIEFKKLSESNFEIVNLTCEMLRLSRFKRDLISVLRRLDKDNHPLKRCVLLNESGFVLLSAKKNPEKLMLLQNQLEREDNHEKL